MFVEKQQYWDKGGEHLMRTVMQSVKQCMGPCFKTMENGSYSVIA